MSEPFLSEVRLMAFNFPPRGWSLCDGQLLLISQNQSLYSLLGTTFGGDGRQNFALPNLQGRAPIHVGNGHTLGQRGGEQNHNLVTNEIPSHTHQLEATNDSAAQAEPTGALLATTGASVGAIYSGNPLSLNTNLNAAAIGLAGGGQAHLNMQPYLVISFCIALQGLYPSRN